MSRHPETSGTGDRGSTSEAGRPTARYGRRWVGLLAAPLIAVLVYFLIPEATLNDAGEVVAGLPQAGRTVAAVGVLMAVLWLSEALPVAATALLPIVLLPLLSAGDVSIQSVTAPYANPLIYLFMGGFMIALAMQQWGLHRRIALRILLMVGSRPTSLVGGFMLATALLSMWISNTATTVMMLPIALSVIELIRRELKAHGDPHLPPPGEPFPFAICLLLGVAYAASIGGTGTLIGTPPNLLLAAFVKDNYGIELTFRMWLPLGLALVVTFLPLCWWLLTRVVFPIRIREIPGGRQLIRDELAKQGPMSRAELGVLVVFLATALAWILRPQLAGLTVAGGRPLAGLTDAGIAVGAAVLLFALPVDLRQGVFLLRLDQALKLPWGILLLFGGGLSLAGAVRSTGVDQFIGRGIEGLDLPLVVLILIVTTLVIFLTELTSNTATTATFLPILGAVAQGLGVDPLWLVVPMALAASCAFMMPVATPPNAIVFGSGEIGIPQMCRAGIWLNLLGIALAVLLVHLVGVPALGIGS